MSRLAIAVAVVLIAWAGAFGVAVGVVEWRDGDATEEQLEYPPYPTELVPTFPPYPND